MQVIVRIRKDVEAMELKLNHADAVYTDMESTVEYRYGIIFSIF